MVKGFEGTKHHCPLPVQAVSVIGRVLVITSSGIRSF